MLVICLESAGKSMGCLVIMGSVIFMYAIKFFKERKKAFTASKLYLIEFKISSTSSVRKYFEF